MTNENRNFTAFIWHAIFLAFASSFIEINTVIPSLILKAGGSEVIIGLITAISIGIPLLAQLLFASILVTKPRKKPYLLLGIYLRIFSLAMISFILFTNLPPKSIIIFTIIGLTIFSFSGIFAGISYTDLLGKSILRKNLKKFMGTRQILRSIFALFGALTARVVINKYKYPFNYSVMFFIASFSLFMASIGFLVINEKKVNYVKKIPSFLSVLKSIPTILTKDKNLLNYIIFSNLTGFGLIIIPFYMSLAKHSFSLNNQIIGNYLFSQMFGVVLASFFWKKILHNEGYKRVLKYCVVFGSFLPILSLISSKISPLLFSLVFVFSGITLSARQMSFEGVLIEISSEENRALYVGISGALNIVTAILPLLIGVVIKYVGFTFVFIFVSVTLLFSLKCLKNLDIK
ncbi:MFS transporter [Thermosipho sp. 1063]|uniref:MFS transporter n=1 Tax=unclassified Thermosipho (in: thermotogales) TaxID=2676525 RepID=UPI0009494DC9|nr:MULTISPECIES: MFS transporter [unclassified Thermosipho (in: thermotogales)]ANQ54531.1 MFS transporter [Thermosipho sp. 1070]APT72972.1 MFS transporter [Thermosipho sp. 1063]OOC42428.1 MFS transporter [Thermosipho sp. 1074]